MKTILVSTDYSKAATNALAYASNLARHVHAKIVLCHAYYMVVTHLDEPIQLPGENDLIQENMKRLKVIAESVTRNYGVEVECYTGSMPVVDFLSKIIPQAQADLVVMGMRGLSMLDQRVFGSTTVSLISKASYPVLVVPEEAVYAPVSKIMLATDFRINRHTNIELLIRLALSFQAHVQVLNVSDQSEAEEQVKLTQLKFLEDILQQVPHEYIIMSNSDITDGIKKAAAQYEPHLLVMVPQRHDFWDVLLNRSNTRKLAFQTHIPLLTLPSATTSGKLYRKD
jgi:nucleotide-binding universal stress UspA family protein